MWDHDSQSTNCYTGDEWNQKLCPDPVTCAKNCQLDAADYEQTYGIIAEGNQVQINFVTKGQYGSNIGARTYMMDTENTYRIFKLKNKEFTFDVDVSQLPCGLK